MLARPFAPFRMRPMKSLVVRKALSADILKAVADEPLLSIKGVRSRLRPVSRMGKTPMRVLKGGRLATEAPL
jgi:hypothetical protein